MWIVDFLKTLLVRFVINVIKCGPIPRHIAFIMDGNRRFAQKHKLKDRDGYQLGIGRMEKMIHLCNDLGIKEISVYAFSLENFNRSKEEVNTLIKLVEEYVGRIGEGHMVKRLGICVRVVGDIDQLPLKTRQILAKSVLDLKNNDTIYLNIVAPYTSRDEITTAIAVIAEGVRSGALKEEDINEQLISDCLYTNHSSDPDMLIRTSGETRLSDFLLWQTGFTQIFFLEPLWQSLSYWDVLKMILRYQRNYEPLKKIVDSVKAPPKNYNGRIRTFLGNLAKTRMEKLERYANGVF